mmetsp:Transcript_27324/g.52012  ORF Transcript_27324/g.52012 Transcript_27324/m.52012 type:complete len:237 (-) Transcript_27324:478-1188(-)
MVNQATLRLQKEYKSLLKDPVQNVTAHPSPSNVLEWHYVLQGAEGSPYAGGYYHGKIVFPEQYPFKPPAISMITPNGRFTTNTRLCLSMSDFHPESWNPMWSVSTILAGLLSFMLEEVATTGSMSTSSEDRKRLAKESLEWNLRSPVFLRMFGDLAVELKAVAAARARKEEEEARTRQRAHGHESGQPHQANQSQHQTTNTRVRERDWEGTLGTGILVIVLLAVMAVPLLHLQLED